MDEKSTLSPSPFSSWTARHAGIRVPDFEEARRWYEEKLEFRLERTMEYGPTRFGFLSPSGNSDFSIELVANPNGGSRPSYSGLQESHNIMGWHHLCLHCDDVNASVAALKERGISIVSEPFDVGPLSIRIAFFADPWGNLFELLETLAL